MNTSYFPPDPSLPEASEADPNFTSNVSAAEMQEALDAAERSVSDNPEPKPLDTV